jgi:hypothetical protein
MDNDKYDLHTIDYSVQGWDSILAADMEIINDNIPTRIIGTIGETVLAYEALYLKTSDSKWYKAIADGVKQPCQGLAVEGRNINADEVIGTDTLNYTCKLSHVAASTNKPITGVDWATYWAQVGSSGAAWVDGRTYTPDEIRIHRMGEIVNTGWAWATIGAPIYLDPSTAGALTQTAPADNVQIVGYAKTATTMIVMLGIPNIGIQKFSQGGTIYKSDGIVDAVNIIIWEAPFACTVTNVKGYRVGGTGATINARRNGVSNHLSSALSLTSVDQWMDGGVVQNTPYALGDKMEIMVISVSGNPTQIAVKINFVRP